MGMTREEAIEILSDKVKPCLSGTDWNDAIDMAIKALEQESTIRNCFVCKYSKNNHNAGTEECHLCMWENQYTPTTKNDLGVDREQLKTMIRGLTKWYVKRDNAEVGAPNTAVGLLYDDVMFGIDRLPSVTPQEPRWIPVSERLPEESGMYLVSGRWKNEPYEVWICEFMYLGELKGWANDAKRPIVTAWMPLPKPYEPQESESEE